MGERAETYERIFSKTKTYIKYRKEEETKNPFPIKLNYLSCFCFIFLPLFTILCVNADNIEIRRLGEDDLCLFYRERAVGVFPKRK